MARGGIAALLLGALAIGGAPMAGPRPVAAQQVYDYGDIPQSNPGNSAALPNATLQNEPGPDEVETQQIGGAGWHVYYQVGALRCPAGEAMVGVRTRRGSVIDFMQVACAPVTCSARGCTWSGRTGHFGPSAGNPNGGQITDAMYCPIGYIVSGFRAYPTADNSYLQDIGFECGRLTGPTRGLSGGSYLGIAAPVEQRSITGMGRGNFGGTSQRRTSLPPRTWAPHQDANGQQLPGTSGNRTGNYISRCTDGGATALSVAVGKWGVGQTPVIQAFSMFCNGSAVGTRPDTE